MRLFSDKNQNVRFFLEVSADRETPLLFKRWVNMRISNGIKTFYNPQEREVFEWDHDLKKTTRLNLLMPFWDKEKNNMCLLNFREDYLAHIRELRRIDRRMRILQNDGSDSDVDASEISSAMDSLKEERAEVEEKIKKHELLHTYAWNVESGQFISTANIQKGDAWDAFSNAAMAIKASRDKLNQAKKFTDDAKEYLDRYDVMTGNYIYNELNHPDFSPWTLNLPNKDEYTKHYDLTVEAWQSARKEFVHAYKEFEEASAVWKSVSSLPETKPHLDLKEGTHLEYDKDKECYFWHCPDNNRIYSLRETDKESRGSLAQVYNGDSGWSVQETLPKWDSVTRSFDNNDVWFNPKDLSYYYLDYSRCTWIFSTSESQLSPSWRIYKPFAVNTSYIELHPSATFDQISDMIERLMGMKRRDFYITENPRTDINGINLEEYTAVDEENPIFKVAKIRIKCTNSDNWSMSNSYNEQGDVIYENTNGGGWKGRRRRHKAKDDWEKPKHSDSGALHTWSDVMYELNTVKEGSKLPCTFEAIRYLGILAGYPNSIAVDFGSSGHSASWENPCVVFRESLFVYCNTGPGPTKGEILVIPRKALYEGTTIMDLQADSIVTNPTGIFARNVERYWGHRPGSTDLSVETVFIALRDPEQDAIVLRKVPNMRKLFQSRVKVFHDWIHSPQNWFWDDERKGFSVFAFTPDMVWVNNHLVQQLAVYHVDMFYGINGKDPEFAKFLPRYLGDRKYLAACWMTVEGTPKYKFPRELRTRMNHAQFQVDGVPFSICEEVKTHYANLMKHLPESRQYDAFVKYYKNVSNHLLHPNAVVLPPEEAGQLPTSKQDIKNKFAIREIETRRLFWRLFKAKFGHSYYEFLTDANIRSGILSASPEPLGPDGCGQYATPNEGSEFLKKWEEQRKDRSDFDRFLFGEFFRNYAFSFTYTRKESKDVVNEAKEFPSPYDGFAELSDDDREKWYWEQASVKLTGHP
jgi:hypothetical protein